MQNKILISIFIILSSCLNYFNVLADEQFNFDVSEIEVLENGKKFKGSNRGTITSDNGITISANEFEYNKVTNILKVNGDIKIEYPLLNYIIFAENATYLKNQNIIITKKKSKIIDNDQRTIIADRFFFDISKNIFNAAGEVKIINPLKEITIYAEEISHIKNKNIYKASGNVKFIDQVNDYQISSEILTYFTKAEKIITQGITNSLIKSRYSLISIDLVFIKKTMNISSNKIATITDNKDNKRYQLSNFNLSISDEILKGENINIDSNIKLPFSDKFFLKSGFFDLKNQSFFTQNIDIKLQKDTFGNSNNDPRIKGISSSSKDGITTINKGIFTSCKKTNNCAPWSIQAKKIEYDQNKKQISYDDALLKVYDAPIFYFPKFFHPGPSVKRQSGFLAPKISNSQILGSAIQTPYYWVLSDNKDYTFTPTLFSENIYKFQNEYRQNNKYSSFIADFSFTDGYKSKTGKNKNSINHFFSKYNSDLNFSNYLESTLDISVQRVSNDTYLKVFDQSIVDSQLKPTNFDTLVSTIEIKLNHEDYDFTTGFVSYEDLQKNKSDRFEFVLPYYSFSKDLWSDQNTGSLNFTSYGDNTLKETNNLRSRIINDFDFKGYNLIHTVGIKNNFNIYLKNLITSGKNDNEYDEKINNELMGIIEMQSSFPMIKTSKNFVNYLDPKISLRINPSEMIDYSNQDRRINNDNIFDINRLGLIDTLESGKSLTLGIDYKKENLDDINKYFEIKLGTVLRDKDNNLIPLNSAITKKNSNIFGKISNNFNNNLSLDYQFSINSALDMIEYNSLGIKYEKDLFVTQFNFIEEQGVIGNTNIIENKSTLSLNNNNFLSFETRQNREMDLAEYYNLIYEYKNDCLIAGIKYNKTYYSDRDLGPSEDLMFTLTLIPITSIGQKVTK